MMLAFTAGVRRTSLPRIGVGQIMLRIKMGRPLRNAPSRLLSDHPALSGIIQYDLHVEVANGAAIMAQQRNRVRAGRD